jgi:hypothetical protein
MLESAEFYRDVLLSLHTCTSCVLRVRTCAPRAVRYCISPCQLPGRPLRLACPMISGFGCSTLSRDVDFVTCPSQRPIDKHDPRHPQEDFWQS